MRSQRSENQFNEKRFVELYQRQYDRIYKLCCLYLGNEQDAEDVLHSIFVKVFEKRIVFKNQNHEDAWFCITARHRCYNLLKSGWRKKRVFEALDEEASSFVMKENFAGINAVEDRIMMGEALKSLSLKQREVLYLYYYEELLIREIADLLGRKESTVLSQLSAGRKKLEKFLRRGEELS